MSETTTTELPPLRPLRYYATGGPAFPVPMAADDKGMSLRDWFAGQALAGGMTRDYFPEIAGAEAYKYADAMLRQRAMPIPEPMVVSPNPPGNQDVAY